ncbi:MAG: response regulator [Kangiellaceae bacterium]
MLETQITDDVQKQFLRRTPIKLKQFSRFLVDIAESDVDSLRLTALLSQVKKTRESCLEQKFTSTAKILNQLIKQLSMSEESLQSQKPLLRRLAKRLFDHATKLSQGVKPQTRQIKSSPKANQYQLDKAGSKNAVSNDSQSESPEEKVEGEERELSLDDIEVIEIKPPVEIEVESESFDFEEDSPSTETIDFESEAASEIELEVEVESNSQLDYLSLYNDKSKLIFLISHDLMKGSRIELYESLYTKLDSLGIECVKADSLKACFDLSQQQGSIIIAPLESAEELSVLDDEAVETKNSPLIFTANEDSQENRLRAIRNKGTGFVIEPFSVSGLFDQIELSFDLNAASPCRILVMEDSKAQARYYEKVLQKGHFEIRVVNNPSIVLEAIRGFDPETILMDMQMPDSSGVELTQMIRQMPRYAHLPIIFLSAEENLRKQNQALMSGGTAFIVKPVQKEQLMFMAKLYTQKFRSLSPQIDLNPDTNLPYPAKFKQIIASETARITRSQAQLALVLIQIDQVEELIANSHFSFINNAINQLTQLLKKRLRQTDIMGHLDTNQLGVILTSGNKKHWASVMRTIQEQFSNLYFCLNKQDKNLSISMGISEGERNFNAYQWLERSNQALDEAIQNGTSQINWID